MKTYNVAILGATGAVGREMMKILEERDFPVGELRLLASSRSVGKLLPFKGQEIAVQEATHDAFEGMDIVLGAAANAVAKDMAPYIVKAGAVFIDNSSAFRLMEDVPLVVPEINPEDVKWHKGIIANPNCTTIITTTAVNGLNSVTEITAMIASTYQAASGAGAGGPVELMNEVEAGLKNETYEPTVFQHQLAFNVIPEIGSPSELDYTTEELKLRNEGRKIMHLPEMKVTCTCVRVPVVRSHSVSVTVQTKDKITPDQAKELIKKAPGCVLVDDLPNHRYPMPLDTSDQDLVFVGRIREDMVLPNALTIWCCGDQVRKGAATNTVQIAELVIKE